jgi:hypothetical protein
MGVLDLELLPCPCSIPGSLLVWAENCRPIFNCCIKDFKDYFGNQGHRRQPS